MLKTTVLSDSFLSEELISFVHPSGLEVKIIPKKQKQSILDDTPNIDIPNINSGFEGGFKINNDILKDDKE